MRKFLISLIVGIIILPSTVTAAEFGSSSDQLVTLEQSQTKKNLYFLGNDIVVNSGTLGDLSIAGNSILLNSDIENSLFFAGKTVTIRGDVGHHVRGVGQQVIISGNVSGDVFLAGSTVTITKDAIIEGDVSIAATKLIIDGKINGSTRIASQNSVLSGTLAGDVKVTSQKLTVTSAAVLAKTIDYAGENEATVEQGAQLAKPIKFTKRSFDFDPYTFPVFNLLLLVGALVLGLGVRRAFPKLIRSVVETVNHKPTPSLLWGAGVIFVAPILVILLFISGVGMPIALMGLSVWVPMVLLGSLISQIALGVYLRRLATRRHTSEITLIDVSIGIISARLIVLIPVVGFLVLATLLIITTGSLILQLIETTKKQQPSS